MATPDDFAGKTLGVWFFGNELPFLSWMSQLRIRTYGSDASLLEYDETGAQTADHKKHMMGQIAKLTAGSNGALDPVGYERKVVSLLAGGSDPVITKAPEGPRTQSGQGFKLSCGKHEQALLFTALLVAQARVCPISPSIMGKTVRTTDDKYGKP